LSSNEREVFPKILKLSSEVSECKPLPVGGWLAAVLLLLHHRITAQKHNGVPGVYGPTYIACRGFRVQGSGFRV